MLSDMVGDICSGAENVWNTSNSPSPTETVEESEAESDEEHELEDFEPEEDTVSARRNFVDKMQGAFNIWESKQDEAGKRRTPHHYPKNSKRT